MDTGTVLILAVVVVLITFVIVLNSKAKKKKLAQQQKELEEFIEKVSGFLTEFTDKGIIPIDCDIKLNKEEHLFALLESGNQKEYRKVRTGNIAGHGIMGRVKIAKGVYYKYGAGQVGIQSSFFWNFEIAK